MQRYNILTKQQTKTIYIYIKLTLYIAKSTNITYKLTTKINFINKFNKTKPYQRHKTQLLSIAQLKKNN